MHGHKDVEKKKGVLGVLDLVITYENCNFKTHTFCNSVQPIQWTSIFATSPLLFQIVYVTN